MPSGYVIGYYEQSLNLDIKIRNSNNYTKYITISILGVTILVVSIFVTFALICLSFYLFIFFIEDIEI